MEEKLYHWHEAKKLLRKGYVMIEENKSENPIHYCNGSFYNSSGTIYLNAIESFGAIATILLTETLYEIYSEPKDVDTEKLIRLHEEAVKKNYCNLDQPFSVAFTKTKEIDYNRARLLLMADPDNMGYIISND